MHVCGGDWRERAPFMPRVGVSKAVIPGRRAYRRPSRRHICQCCPHSALSLGSQGGARQLTQSHICWTIRRMRPALGHSPAARLSRCQNVEDEYWAHVSSQEELPIAAGVDRLPVVDQIDGLLEDLPDGSDSGALGTYFSERLLTLPELLNQLRLLLSLSDKRLYLDLSYHLSRELDPGDASKTLCGCLPHKLTKHGTSYFVRLLASTHSDGAVAKATADVIAEYLLDKGLADVCRLYASLDEAKRDVLMKTLVLPGEFRQNEAKRRGHGAEVELARVILAVGGIVVPADKLTNPMGHDPNVTKDTFTIVDRIPGETFSFDLIVTSEDRVRVCIQSLIHSSDPGQFGVDKSNETVSIRDQLDVVNADRGDDERVEIWCLLDGVGYSENKNGTINKMLPKAHTFVQLKSLYKAPLRLHALGLCSLRAVHFDSTFYSPEAQADMMRYVPEDVVVIEQAADIDHSWTPVPAGKATVYT